MKKTITDGVEIAEELEGFDIGGLMMDDFVAELPFDEEKGVFVQIRHQTREELLSLRKKSTIRVADKKSHQMVEQVDSVKADLNLSRAAVVGWRGLRIGGAEFPFSEENADMLMKKWSKWAKFVNDACDDLERISAAAMEKEGKKLLPTS